MTGVCILGMAKTPLSSLRLSKQNTRVESGYTQKYFLKKCLSYSAALLSLSLVLPSHTAADTGSSIPSVYVKVAKKERVPLSLLYAISRTESTDPKIQKVWPWTINFRGKGFYFKTKKQAYAAIKLIMEKGHESVDIGLMQTNWYWHKDKLKSPWKALDPEYNVTVGAKILRACYERKKDWWYCAGEYHSRSNTPERKARVEKYRKRILSYLKVYK